MLSVSLAIPCVSRHVRFLEGLFADVVAQTLTPIEVQRRITHFKNHQRRYLLSVLQRGTT